MKFKGIIKLGKHFREIEVGDVFVFDFMAYLKISETSGFCFGDKKRRGFMEYDKVIPLETTLTFDKIQGGNNETN